VSASKLFVGQVWRTAGAYGWQRVEAVLLPGSPEYDGGLPGVVVRERFHTGRWGMTWFIPAADEAAALKKLATNGYQRRPEAA
jgi:hypothetical protein